MQTNTRIVLHKNGPAILSVSHLRALQKGKQCDHFKVTNIKISLSSKQSSLFPFKAVPSSGTLVHLQSLIYCIK